MRKVIIVSIFAVAAGLVLSPAAFAQGASDDMPAGWRKCPECQTPAERKESEKYKPADMPFNPRDLSGVWGSVRGNAVRGPGAQVFPKEKAPAMTPWGKERFDATRTEDPKAVSNLKDPMLRCDPLGWPRLFTYNYGFEFYVWPDRVLQNFAWGNAWRIIWTDGRKLPDVPPEPRFMGWAVGHWEPDNTFVIESNGYDDRSWLFEDWPDRKAGWTHSEEMRIEERWKRTSYGTLDAQLTIIDPKTYTGPLVSEVSRMNLLPGAEMWEYLCVPTDATEHIERLLPPTAGAAPR